MTDKIIAFTTCGSADEAERVAAHLVDTRVAACVNILPGVQSVYRWKGAVERAPEWLLLIKTRRGLLDQLQRELRKVHSYELPELIASAVVDGLPDYLAWIDQETLPDPTQEVDSEQTSVI